MTGPAPTLTLSATVERFPISGAFTIARGSKTEAAVVVASISDGVIVGRGEAVPYARYGESVDGVLAQIGTLERVPDRAALQGMMPAGAARNAIDCALWDFDAKRTGRPAASLAGVVPPAVPHLTCYTLSLGTPQDMARKAREAADKSLLKIKLGAPGDADRMRAIRQARPDARLVADANEGWPAGELAGLLTIAAEAGFELIEQPLPAGHDGPLRDVPRPVPVCADESVHTSGDIARVVGLYDAVNIKLDKAGGLTEALAMTRDAKAAGLKIMVGCMVASSLAMAPAWLLAADADWLDLDGPLLLARDRAPAITYIGDRMHPPCAALWG